VKAVMAVWVWTLDVFSVIHRVGETSVVVTVSLNSGKRSHVTPLVRDAEKRTTNSTSWRNYFRFRRPLRASWTRRRSFVWRSATSSCATSPVMVILRGSATPAPAQSQLPLLLKVGYGDCLSLVKKLGYR